MDRCSQQNDTIEACCLRNGYPAVCPVLSCHSEKPVLKLQPTSICTFYKGGRIDGKKYAKEWDAGLTAIHYLSTKAALGALRSQRKMKPLTFSPEDSFFLI